MSRSTKDVWLDPKAAPVDRLNAFHRWLSWRIARLFRLERSQERLLGQLHAVVLQAVRDLNERGFLIDGKALASFLEDKLTAIAAYHERAQVRELYVYFRKSWDGWVALRAEELKADSLRLGMHISSLERQWDPSIPQLETQRHEESLTARLAKRRQAERRAAARGQQKELFG